MRIGIAEKSHETRRDRWGGNVNNKSLSNPKQPSCKKKCAAPKGHSEKRCEIQGGGQEMAVMVG